MQTDSFCLWDVCAQILKIGYKIIADFCMQRYIYMMSGEEWVEA